MWWCTSITPALRKLRQDNQVLRQSGLHSKDPVSSKTKQNAKPQKGEEKHANFYHIFYLIPQAFKFILIRIIRLSVSD
jgi:hypothetical protein